MALIFDSHAHYDDSQFDEDRDTLLKELPVQGVCGVIHASTNRRSALFGLELTEKYPYFYATVGLHPGDLEDADEEDMAVFRELLSKLKIIGVGEIGLDYHYDTFPRDVQRYWFEKQLELACEQNVPVVIHDREAHEDTLKLLRQYRPSGVVHCFSGSVEMAKEIIKLGMSIGLGGAVTFKNARKPAEVAAAIPLDKLLLETDAPYMTPVPFRGKRCDSRHIRYTAEKIAELRGLSADEVIKTAADNTRKLFGIE